MVGLSRQLSLAEEAEGKRYYRRHGLPPSGNGAPLIIHTRKLVSLLADQKNGRRASEAAAASLRSTDLSMQNHPADIKLACKRGCSFCCYDLVVATAPEVIRLAWFIHTQMKDGQDVLRRIETVNLATKGMTPDEREVKRHPCSMLEASACTGYSARPLVCRGANSANAALCGDGFNDGVTNRPTVGVPLLRKDGHALCLVAALIASGLDAKAYELNHALCIAVSEPDAERRWLAGEDVFAGVQLAPPLPPAMPEFVQQIVAEL